MGPILDKRFFQDELLPPTQAALIDINTANLITIRDKSYEANNQDLPPKTTILRGNTQ